MTDGGDGFGASNFTRLSCIQHNNYVIKGGDCKKRDANEYPGKGCPNRPGIEIFEENVPKQKAMVDIAAEISIFPNPNSQLTVVLNGFEAGKKLELQMVQADGKVVAGQSLTHEITGQQVRMDVRRLSAGYYLLQARQGVLQQTKKVMIIR